MREPATEKEDAACPVCGAESAERLRHDTATCTRRAERRAALRVMKAEIEDREREVADAKARYFASAQFREEAREYADAYVADYEAEHGPIPQEAMDEAAAVLRSVASEPEG